MPSPERDYFEFREEVEKFNTAGKPFSFCKSIEGGCCTPNILIQKGDTEYIRDAIQKGEIPRDTVKRAQTRARDSEVDRCPFLGEESECTIYPQRPLTCIAYGNGGMPVERSQREAILTASSEDIIEVDIAPAACENCFSRTEDKPILPTEIVQLTLILYEQINKAPLVPMRDFLTKTLPHY